MVCEYFGEVTAPVCRARRGTDLVIPTIIEEVRYCLTERYKDCVHWRERRRERGVPYPEERRSA
jgi:hypothetical protein